MSLPLRTWEAWESAVAHVDAREIALGVALFVISLVGSLGIVTFVLCRLPVDYLHRDPAAAPPDARPAWQRVLSAIGRNILGVILVMVGVVLSLPGVPGQGLLTILIGVMLLDIPGKRELERRLICRPPILRSINRLRARFGKPPLEQAATET